MKVYVDCIGCEQRKLDAQRIITYLTTNGISLVNSPEICDYAILVTCAVDKPNESRSISKLEEISRRIPASGKLVVGGCLPSINPELMAKYDIYTTFSPRTLHALERAFGSQIKKGIESFSIPNRSTFDCKDSSTTSPKTLKEEFELAKKGYKIVIDHGCLLHCSYCSIKKATGKLKSEPMDAVISQFRRGTSLEEPTIMLVGGDTGAYGRDIGLRFYNLLESLVDDGKKSKIFIHDFNINWLIEDLKEYVKVFEKSDGIIRAATFPIQSGSDRILKLMRRPYTQRETIQALTNIRESAAKLGIGTHIIVGFPTETDSDFEATLKVLEETNLDFISCFPYSENKHTASARIREKIEPKTIQERLQKINKLFGEKVTIF